MESHLPHSDQIGKKELLILIFCLLAGFTLRFYTFEKKSLWLDEVYTFNDSRYDIREQLAYYKENPTFLHPPLFFLVTHLFYPFTHPERDLRIIPLIFGTLSIPMIFLLARSFSGSIALPCTISLTFMAYHISLSQDGRSYSFLMFLGMAGLYFFMKHLLTLKRRYLLLTAIFFSILFHASYSSIPFIVLSQILWFYRPGDTRAKPAFLSPVILNGSLFLLCLPWLVFVASNYNRGAAIVDPIHTEGTGSLWQILYGLLHDWVPHLPLMISSVILLFLFPLFSKSKKNAFTLLAVFLFPIGGLYLFCKLLNLKHFITSRYFINFLPLFFITLYLSIDCIETHFEKLKRFLRLKPLFVFLFIVSNLVILPLYYRSEKQDFRALVFYLKDRLKDGDKIIVGGTAFFPGMLHYFGVIPAGRHYSLTKRKVSEDEIEYRVPLIYNGVRFTMIYSRSYWFRYFSDGSRMWIVADRVNAKRLTESFPCVFKGYFDGSFLNFARFPFDVSMYLLLRDPSGSEDKGIELPLE